MVELHHDGFACVDPEVGERIVELEHADLDPQAKQILEAHLEVCAHCRTAVDLERELGRVLKSDHRPRSSRIRLWTGGAAILATAAGIASMMLLPPQPVGPDLLLRGDIDARFESPVEGEVVPGAKATVRWSPVADAESYRVQLTDLETGEIWSGSTEETHWSLSGVTALTSGHTYRLVLGTTPDDLLPPGSVSRGFRAGSTLDVAAHRVQRAQPISYGLLGLGALLALVSLVVRRR